MVRGYKSLSATEIATILELNAAGTPAKAIAGKFDISTSTVGTVVRNHAGSSLTEIEEAIGAWHQYRRFWVTLFNERVAQNGGATPPILFTSEQEKEVFQRLQMTGNPYDPRYNVKSRGGFPDEMRAVAPEGMEWRIDTLGKGKYAFVLAKIGEGVILPSLGMKRIKMLDAIPSIVERYSRRDEQALLARIRYNNLVGVFLGLSVYSLQSHWKTSAGTGAPIEIDEVYVGMDANGCHYVVPVEAKSVGPRENVTAKQILDNHRAASTQFPGANVVSVAAKVMDDYAIAMWRLDVDVASGTVTSAFERHYELARNPAAASPQPTLSDLEARAYAPLGLAQVGAAGSVGSLSGER